MCHPLTAAALILPRLQSASREEPQWIMEMGMNVLHFLGLIGLHYLYTAASDSIWKMLLWLTGRDHLPSLSLTGITWAKQPGHVHLSPHFLFFWWAETEEELKWQLNTWMITDVYRQAVLWRSLTDWQLFMQNLKSVFVCESEGDSAWSFLLLCSTLRRSFVTVFNSCISICCFAASLWKQHWGYYLHCFF